MYANILLYTLPTDTMLFAIFSFLIGSAGCGAATSSIMLIIFRALAGMGGAGLFGLVFIIIADIFPLEERPRYQAIIGSSFGFSSVFGPLLGGGEYLLLKNDDNLSARF